MPSRIGRLQDELARQDLIRNEADHPDPLPPAGDAEGLPAERPDVHGTQPPGSGGRRLPAGEDPLVEDPLVPP